MIPTCDGGGPLAITLTLALSLSHSLGLITACASSRVDPALHMRLNAGSARVLVELHLGTPFVPEGRLPDGGAIAAQRQAIEAAQEQLLSALRGTRFSLAHRYTTIPFLALTVDRDALAILERRDDLVSGVVEDTEAARPTPPSPPASTR